MILSIVLLVITSEALGLLARMVRQRFRAQKLISYSIMIALLAPQLIPLGILVKIKIHLQAVLLDITLMETNVQFALRLHLHGLIVMMLQQLHSVLQDFI